MPQLRSQIRRADRRLFLNRVVQSAVGTTFATLVLALMAVLIPKMWPLPFAAGYGWGAAWLAGGLAAGLLAAVAWALVRHRGELDAAWEIDRRYGLEERVASALSLSAEQLQTAAGQALLDDAQRRVSRIDVRERFGCQPGWRAVLPLVAATSVLLVALLVPDAVRDSTADSHPASREERQKIRNSVAELQKRLAQQKQRAEANGLREYDAVITQATRAVDELTRQDMDRKQVLVKLNQLSQQLAGHRQDVEAGRKTRDLLMQLPGAQQGPGDGVTRALQQGDVQLAMKELNRLTEKLQNSTLTEQQAQPLAGELQKLGEEIERTLGARSDSTGRRPELQQRISQLRQEGRLAESGMLQRKVDQLQAEIDSSDRPQPQMRQSQELADRLEQCARCLRHGQCQEAAQHMDQLVHALGQLQQQLEGFRTLDEIMTDIADAKRALSCSACGGEGCDVCRSGTTGMLGNDELPEQPGRGLGQVGGLSDRPEEETPRGGYRTQVRADPRRGEAVRAGEAGGPNIAGTSQQQVREEIAAAFGEDPAPVAQEHLPRREREQAREYFELLRKGH